MTAPHTTDEWWDIDGVSLHRPGWNVSTLGGRFNVPPLRGNDQTFAYVPGEEWREKLPASRNITLNMWTQGVDSTTGAYDVDQRRKWNDNWRFLTNLFWTPDRQILVTRRWLLSDGNDAPYIQTAEALAQYVGGLEPSMTGRTRSTFAVELKLHDPFFYGAQTDTQVNVGSTVTIHNPGDAVAAYRNLYVFLVGPLTNPVLRNNTPNPDVWVKYAGSITAGQVIRLDIEKFTAFAADPEFTVPESPNDPPPMNRLGYISHSGSPTYMGLLKKNNSLTLTADSGTGHAIVRFRPPYL